jgi:hypothetical protein
VSAIASRDGRNSPAPAFAWGTVLVGLFLVAACGDGGGPEPQSNFEGFVREVAETLSADDVERLVVNTSRVRIVCDEQRVEALRFCRGREVGSTADGFDVKFYGSGEATVVMDGPGIRQMFEGMLGGQDLAAPPDDIGGPGITVYSTRFPDEAEWFPNDDPENLPVRGDIAITYVGTSSEYIPAGDGSSEWSVVRDSTVERRLWAALAEQDEDGIWKIRLWLVGWPAADHPAMNPSEENGFTRWPPAR